MKQVVNGKTYDTEKAGLIGVFESKTGTYSWTIETLYRKRTGEFFLHGKGSALSKYTKNKGNNEWTDGEDIIPLTFEVAKKWTRENLHEDIYNTSFGHSNEEDKKKTISMSIRASAHQKAKIEASRQGISVSEYVENLIINAENQNQRENKK